MAAAAAAAAAAEAAVSRGRVRVIEGVWSVTSAGTALAYWPGGAP